MVNTKLSIYLTTDDGLEFWGTYGGYGSFYSPIKPTVIYARIKFWGLRWGLRVPRNIRVIYIHKSITTLKGKKEYETNRKNKTFKILSDRY